MERALRSYLPLCWVMLWTLSGGVPGQNMASAQQNEENLNYFQRWLEEDVLYVISEEEQAVFKNLTNDLERERFIEQFWLRRDPDPRTAENEFKEEHYRRIAYANQWFASGIPGWRTDRGRIYIMHGPPDQRDTYPSGGTYHRPEHEGGGSTSVFPFEIWRYRHVEGVGDDVELEFVDPVGGGEYRLALDPEEKDALRHVPGIGLTWAEARGQSNKSMRSSYKSFRVMRAKDSPFERYETFVNVQRPPEIRFKDLQELVKVSVSYEEVDYTVRVDSFRLNETTDIVPVTLQIPNSQLSYGSEGEHFVAHLAVYGLVTDLGGRIAAEFEDDLVSAYSAADLARGRKLSSAYQKLLFLEPSRRYKLDLVVRDQRSSRIGVKSTAIIPGDFSGPDLRMSSVLLSNHVRQVADSDVGRMFVLGDLKIHPSPDNTFSKGAPVGAYLQLYNFGVDQASGEPSIRVVYSLFRDGHLIQTIEDQAGTSILSLSDDRAVLLKALSADLFNPGNYRVRISVTDAVSGQKAEVEASFRIEDEIS